MKVPLFVPWISNADKKVIISSLSNSQLTDGPILRKFESKFSKFVNSKNSIGVSNGTAALHLALQNLEIGNGDEVIIPNFTFVATANSVILTGATPILADINSSLNISTKSIERKISKNTRAIIPVHFAGYPCEMNKIMKIAKEHKLKVIEDCAHSLGSYYNNKHVGTFGNAGCFSFYPTKNITTIEGGMVITNSNALSKKIEKFRNQGLTKNLIQRNKNTNPWNYDVVEPGNNYRLDEVRASLGLSQLSRFKKITKKRINAAKYYNKKLKNLKGVVIVNSEHENKHVYHLYIIRIKENFGASRNQIHKYLFKKGIRTTVHYKPLHLLSLFKKFRINEKELSNSISAYNECLTLPLFPTISRKQQDYVINQLSRLQK